MVQIPHMYLLTIFAKHFWLENYSYKYILRVIFGPNHEIKNIFFHHQVLPCKKLIRQIRGTLGSLFGYSAGQNYTSQYIFGLCDLKHARAGEGVINYLSKMQVSNTWKLIPITSNQKMWFTKKFVKIKKLRFLSISERQKFLVTI